MWAVQAILVYVREEWKGTMQVPTFYLLESVQGFTDEEGAKAVARNILLTGTEKALELPNGTLFKANITATRIADEPIFVNGVEVLT